MNCNMKKKLSVILCGLLIFGSMAACSQKQEGSPAPAEETAAAETEAAEEKVSWEDLYSQGLECLAAEDYDGAVKAFTEAIAADPEQAPVYVGRGDAYVRLEGADAEVIKENLMKAYADYEKAAGLDETYAAAYLGMADVLIRQESFEEAYDLLVAAEGKVTDSAEILGKVQEIEKGSYVDSSAQIRRKNYYDPSGNLTGYQINEFDQLGRRSGWRNYENAYGNGIELYEYCVVTFGDNGLPARNDYYNPDGSERAYQTMEYDDRGLEVRRDAYSNGSHMGYYLTYYDDEGKETGYDTYNADGSMAMYSRYDYDENGSLLQQNNYNPDSTLIRVIKPSDE